MKLLTGLLGGAVAGLVGASVWAAVVFYTHYEYGILAWAIGAAVGAGVLIGSGRAGGSQFGLIAAGVAIVSILLGKWAWVELVTPSVFDDEYMISEVADNIIEERREAGQQVDHLRAPEFARSLRDAYAVDLWTEAERRWTSYSREDQARLRRVPSMLNEQVHLAYLADSVCLERESRGEAIDWPTEHDVTTAWREAHYPADIWAEAVRRWNSFSPEDQQKHMTWVEYQERQRQREFQSAIRPEMFLLSFSLFDALWLLLAVLSAYGIAARSEA